MASTKISSWILRHEFWQMSYEKSSNEGKNVEIPSKTTFNKISQLFIRTLNAPDTQELLLVLASVLFMSFFWIFFLYIAYLRNKSLSVNLFWIINFLYSNSNCLIFVFDTFLWFFTVFWIVIYGFLLNFWL